MRSDRFHGQLIYRGYNSERDPQRARPMTVSVTIGLAIAAVAAAATSLGWLMKSRGAQASVPMRHDRPWRSLRALLASRWFAVGVLVATAGGALHIAALALAPISTVQTVMAGGIVLLGVMAERLFGWPVPSRQWAGVALTALGLVALTVSLPGLRGAHSAARAPAMIGFDLGLLAVTGLLLLAPRLGRLRAHDGALIGAASGVLFALSDLGVKALYGTVGHGLVAVLLSPWLALALLGGMLAQYISARSLQTGDAVTVTALTGVAVNVANIAGGIIIFGDPLAHGLAGSLIEAAAFAAICAGAFLTPISATTERRVRSGATPRPVGSSPAAAHGQGFA
jgi:drug/metabolite transporter (DMT)-like permease